MKVKTSIINFFAFCQAVAPSRFIRNFQICQIKVLTKCQCQKNVFTIRSALSKHLEIENLLKENNYNCIKNF